MGIRAHQLISSHQTRKIPFLLGSSDEHPPMIRISSFTILPTNPSDYHLQAEVPKKKWLSLKTAPSRGTFRAATLILMEE